MVGFDDMTFTRSLPASGPGSGPTARWRRRLLAGAALMAIPAACPALAQDATSPAAQAPSAIAPSAPAAAEGEIIVTATKREERLSRVPASIAAVTQDALDRASIRTVSDLAQSVPSLSFRPTAQDGSTTIAIRGIISTQGTSTTGVFLDDVPLQRRSAAGAISGSGTPFPQLFDLQRVEVLRGPQGTLFGGSSQGGAVRFITPTPSLTETSIYARGEVAFTDGGGPTFEVGAGFGAPIVDDKIGIRVSAVTRRNGGWIDRVNPTTLEEVNRNINAQRMSAGRAQVLFALSESVRLSLALYGSTNDADDSDFHYPDVPQHTQPARSYNAAGLFTTNPALAVYTVPAHTYPAAQYSPDKIATFNANSFHNTLLVPSFTLEADLGPVTFKSITSYVYDHNSGQSDQPIGQQAPITNFSEPAFYLQPGVNDELFVFTNNRDGFNQELRLATRDPSAFISAVGGLFYSRATYHVLARTFGNLDAEAMALTGTNSLVRFGVACGAGCTIGTRVQTLKDSEAAVFGDVTIRPTSRIRATAGLRVSRDKFSFDSNLYGAVYGYSIATQANGGLSTGKVSETPITPKFSLSYDLTDSSILYASAAKGFRVGGVNSGVPIVLCAPGVTAVGGVPPTYKSDSLWSYEGGTKLALFGGRARLSASGYYIKWKDIQTRVTIPGCPQYNLTANAAKAVSKGFDFEGSVRLLSVLRATAAVSYTDAHYSATTTLGPAASIIVNKGDELPVSPWTINLGLELTEPVGGGSGYVTGNYEYQSAYRRTTSFPTPNYNADAYPGNSTRFVKMRAGFRTNRFDLSLFVDNLLNSTDTITYAGVLPGRSRCTTAACTSYGAIAYVGYPLTFRPRTIGMTFTLRK